MFSIIHFHPEDDSGGSGGGEEEKPDPDEDGGSGAGGSGGEGGQEGTPEMVPRSELSKANADAAKRRKELREAQARIAELEGHSKTENEKLQDQVKRAETDRDEAQQEVRNLLAIVVGERVGIVPEAREDAARLLDWSSVEDQSDAEQVEKALRELAESKPYLLGNVPGGADGGAGGDRRNQKVDMNKAIREAAGRQ